MSTKYQYNRQLRSLLDALQEIIKCVISSFRLKKHLFQSDAALFSEVKVKHTESSQKCSFFSVNRTLVL